MSVYTRHVVKEIRIIIVLPKVPTKNVFEYITLNTHFFFI